MSTPETLVLLRFNEPDDQVRPSDAVGSLADLDVGAGLALPPVENAFTGFGRAFSNGFGLDALDVVPGSSLATRDVTVRAILSWDLDAQNTYGQSGTIVARGKGDAAAEYVAYALELRVVNAALQIGELRWWWQDLAGNVKTQTGGQFILPPPGGFMMLTATRHWVSSDEVELRYYAGDRLIGEFLSADGDIGGGTIGTFCVGTRYSAGVAGAFLCGVIDELQVLNYEVTAEETAATWQRLSVLQPRGYKAMRDLLQPGAPVSSDPASRFQKLLRVAGHALGFAAAQAENVRANLLPDRAYGPALEQWEGIVGEAPRAPDTVATRRARVVGHLRQRAGSSVPGVAATVADLLQLGQDQVEMIGFDQTIRDDFSQGLRAQLWCADPIAQWTIAGGALRVQAAGAADITYDGGSSRSWYTCLAAALGSRSTGNANDTVGSTYYDGREAHIIAKISPTSIPDRGEVGVVFYDWVNDNALLLGLRNTGGVYQVITESIVGHVSQGVTIQALAALATTWLHLGPGSSGGALPAGYVNFQAAWSTTSETAGYASSPDIGHPKAFGWLGLYARSYKSGGVQTLAGALDVSFDDVILRCPYSDRPFRWYVYRDPALPGAPDIVGAEAALRRLAQAHTDAHVITNKSLLADDPTTGADRTPTGGF